MKKIFDINNIPKELQHNANWVVRKNKRPISPSTLKAASTTNSEHWSSLSMAVEVYNIYSFIDGIGYVFEPNNGIVGIDIDTCREPKSGQISAGARRLVELFDSYTEISPSGYGLHILIMTEPNYHLPFNKKKMNPNSIERYENKNGVMSKKEPEVEIYNSGRYFTFTGDIFENHKNLEYRTKQLNEFFSKYPLSVPVNPTKSRTKNNHKNYSYSSSTYLSDDEVIERAAKASNGAVFYNLFNGNIQGYASESNADLALCNMLAFWCNGDRFQMDRIFRSSRLYRRKWDELRGTQTYGEITINKALATCRNYYIRKSI